MEPNLYTAPSSPPEDPINRQATGARLGRVAIFKAWIVFFLISMVAWLVVAAAIGAAMMTDFMQHQQRPEDLATRIRTITWAIYASLLPISYTSFRFSVRRFLLHR